MLKSSAMSTPGLHPLCQSLGLQYPVWQAPMAGVQDAGLALAVSAAGGLGALPAAMLSLDALDAQMARLATSGLPWQVNFFAHEPPVANLLAEQAWMDRLAPWYAAAGLDASAVVVQAGRMPFDAAAAERVERWRPPVVSFHFGLPPEPLLSRVRATGARIVSSATTVAEGVWLQDRGVDAVIAQGLEAGGHRGHFLSHDLDRQSGLWALLPALLSRLTVPVIAAGGIVDATAVRTALSMGAAAVQCGTVWLRSHEATTSPLHRQRLAMAQPDETVLTTLFSGRPARGLVNRFMREMGARPEGVPAFPRATSCLAPLRAKAEALGRDDFTPLWCGQRPVCPDAAAGDILANLVAELS